MNIQFPSWIYIHVHACIHVRKYPIGLICEKNSPLQYSANVVIIMRFTNRIDCDIIKPF